MQRVRALQRAQITHNHTGRPIVEWSAWQRLQLEGGWGGRLEDAAAAATRISMQLGCIGGSGEECRVVQQEQLNCCCCISIELTRLCVFVQNGMKVILPLCRMTQRIHVEKCIRQKQATR